MQSVQRQTSDELSHQLISARTIFSVRPTDPPSSPPPTSPLPPLPQVAHYRPARSASSVSPVPRFDRPRRPPRPSVSLSDLKPRTIQSPEIARRQRSAELAAQTRTDASSATQPPDERSVNPVATSPQKRASVRLLAATPDSTSNFSDDVLSALPKVFQRCSPTPSRGNLSTRTTTPTGDDDDRIRAWQVYHGTLTKGSLKYKKPRKEAHKAVARSALFMPNRPFPTRRDSLQHRDTSPQPCQANNLSSENALKSKRALFSPFQSPKRQNSDDGLDMGVSCAHLDTLSIDTNVGFNFGHSGSLPSYTSQASIDNLTSLPQLPPTPASSQSGPSDRDVNTQIPSHHDRSTRSAKVEPMSPAEAAAFTAIPYVETSAPIAQPLGMTRILTQSYGATEDCELQSAQLLHRVSTSQGMEIPAEEEIQPLSEEQVKKVRQKRLLWALTTIALVLLATAGILGGIIWKLHSLR